MSLPQVGGVVTIDGISFDVESAPAGLDGVWLKECGGTTYFYSLRWLSAVDAADLRKSGRLVNGLVKPVKGGEQYCLHVWRRYTGMTRVYDYCVFCDAKIDVSWRNL
jgi:hypothetical protein